MIHVYIERDLLSFSDRISIVDRCDDGHCDDGSRTRILRLGTGELGESWEQVVPGASSEPTLRLGTEAARALLDALAARFEGSEGTRTLRRDYDAERARVDKLIDNLARTTSTLAAGATGHA